MKQGSLRYSKSSLAILLSKLQQFKHPDAQQEQYVTDSEIAAELIWTAHLEGNITGKTVVDLGCGTGILSIGIALLGGKVTAVEQDKEALQQARENTERINKEFTTTLNIVFVEGDVKTYKKKADTVIQNPPFGTKEKHTDIMFLEQAMHIAPVIYSLHKTATLSYIEKYAKKNNFITEVIAHYEFPLKATQQFHKKRIQRIKVSAIRLHSNPTL